MGSGKDRKKKQKKQQAAATGKPVAKAKSTGKAKKRQPAPGDIPEDEKDIETILEELRREHEASVRVTEESAASPPSPRCNAALVSIPGSSDLLLFGGEFFNGQRCIFYNDLFRYNTERNEWRRFTSPTCPGPRSSHQLVTTATGRAFLFGGEFASMSESQFFHYKDFWMLDLKTHQWERLELKGTRPSPRSGHRMVLWKHYLLLFGGFYDTLKETKYFDDLWIFDTNEYAWKKIEFRETDMRPRYAPTLY